MTTVTGSRAAVRRLAEPIRRRVRLRTRLRRAREAWRRAVPGRLPRWRSGDALAPAGPPVTGVRDGAVVVAAVAAAPAGQRQYGDPLPTGELRLHPDRAGGIGWQVVRGRDRVPVVAGRVGQPLDQRQSAVLARLGAIACPVPPEPATAWAQLVVQLAISGVVLYLPAGAPGRRPYGRRGQRPALDLTGAGAAAGDAWRAAGPVAGGPLAAELAGILAEPLPPRGADPMLWETRGIRQRRAAMRHHLAGLDPPPVTAVLVSKRPRLVVEAVEMLAAQTYPRLEVVVGMHGAAAPQLPAMPALSPRVLAVPQAQPLGGALAAATAAASGQIVTKVDDDDRYGPEHIWDLVIARHRTGAAVTGKGAEFVYLEAKDLTVRRRMAAETVTDTVAGGTIAVGRDELAALGGWPPVPRSVDRALLDRAVAAGASIYRTHPFGFIYTRHGDGHTWEPGLEYFLRDPVRRWRGLPPYPEFGTTAT